MKTKQNKPDLSKLPMHIHKQSANIYMNIHTGERIHINQLHKHLPIIPKEIGHLRWDLNY